MELWRGHAWLPLVQATRSASGPRRPCPGNEEIWESLLSGPFWLSSVIQNPPPPPHRPLSVVVLPISLHLLFPLFSTDSSPGYFFSPCIFLFPLGLPSNFLSSGFLPVGSALAPSILRGTGRGRPSLLLPVAAPLSLSSLLS